MQMNSYWVECSNSSCQAHYVVEDVKALKVYLLVSLIICLIHPAGPPKVLLLPKQAILPLVRMHEVCQPCHRTTTLPQVWALSLSWMYQQGVDRCGV